MKNFKYLSILLLMVAVMFSCREDINITETDTTVNPPEIITTASVSGVVIDKDGNPIEDAIVSIGTKMFQTDENGVFIFRSIEMNEYGTYIKVLKTGYFDGSKFVTPTFNTMSFVKFMLIEKQVIGSFNSTDGGTVTTNGGAVVTIPSNGIVSANGTAYSGTVDVYATWINPTGPNASLQMPGDLRAVDGDNNFVQLATYGMVGVELESPSGEKLQIADGSEATVEFPLPSDLQSSAPSSIPLWHFDESNGYWIEEGSATKQGDKYVGKVSHFSFWNCDAPFELIELTGSVVDANGNGVANVPVRIEFISGSQTGYGYTNENGVFAGKVPKDELLRIVILDDCGVEIYSAEIGPFSENTTLDPIVFSTTENTLTVSGNLVDCDSNPVPNGYIKVNYQGGYTSVFVEEDGSFNQTISICSATEVTLVGVDIDNQLQSASATYNVEGQNDLDAGTLTACDELDEFFTYAMNGAVFFGTEIDMEYESDSMGGINAIYLFSNVDTIGTAGYASLAVEAGDVGTYNPIYMQLYDSSNPNGNGAFCQGNCETITVVITEFGGPGGIIRGTFEGTLESGGGTVDITDGAFKVIRPD